MSKLLDVIKGNETEVGNYLETVTFSDFRKHVLELANTNVNKLLLEEAMNSVGGVIGTFIEASEKALTEQDGEVR